MTDEVKPRRLGPKRASGIRKLYVSIDGPKNGFTDRLINDQVLKVVEESVYYLYLSPDPWLKLGC